MQYSYNRYSMLLSRQILFFVHVYLISDQHYCLPYVEGLKEINRATANAQIYIYIYLRFDIRGILIQLHRE